MQRFLSPFVLVIILITSMIGYAECPVKYSYVGPFFNSFDGIPSPWNYDSSDRVEVTLTTTEGFLPDSNGLQDITPYIDCWTFTDGMNTIQDGLASEPIETNKYFANALVIGGEIKLWSMRAEYTFEDYGNYDNFITIATSLSQTETYSYDRNDSGRYFYSWYPIDDYDDYYILYLGRHVSSINSTTLPDSTGWTRTSPVPGVCGCGIPDTDTDLDGTPDCNDNCSNDPNKTQPGICGCGIADTDSDGDGIPDCNDNCDNSIDSDGDGLNDCDDLCPEDPNKTEPGDCGCGIADSDLDGDGTFDCMDSNDDNDGLPDGEEQGPDRNNPNYDGNGDGIADHLQGNVASFHTYNDQNYITIVSPSGTSIRNCKAVKMPSESNSPQNVDFTHGFFGFSIDGVDPGGVPTATMYFPAGETFSTYYKYGPTPDNPINHWYEFLQDGQTGANINGNVITLHFVDGMRGDDDLTTNGTISDIGAPGVSVDSGDGNASPVDNGSGGGGGGCFISMAMYGFIH